jgi:hypothetical protein
MSIENEHNTRLRRSAGLSLPGGRGSCRTKAKLGRSLALPSEPLKGSFHSAARLMIDAGIEIGHRQEHKLTRGTES